MEPNRTVWLVDDDALIRRLAEQQGERRGVPMRMFESGTELLDTISGQPPALLIVDKEMPGRSGIDVGRAAREAGFCGAMILWTASPSRDVVAGATAAGFDRVLSKAVSLENILVEVGLAA